MYIEDDKLHVALWVMVMCSGVFFFFFKQKTAYEILTCDWSSDVCSSDLWNHPFLNREPLEPSVPKQKTIGTTQF